MFQHWFQFWQQHRPDIDITEQRLADQRRQIMIKSFLTNVELQLIKEEIIQLQQGNNTQLDHDDINSVVNFTSSNAHVEYDILQVTQNQRDLNVDDN